MLKPAISVITAAIHSNLKVSPLPSQTGYKPWHGSRDYARVALAICTNGAEAKRRMKPDAPEITADSLHPWVWDAARPMWEAGSLQTALQHAASSINARLQQKLDRYDLSESKLCQEAFSQSPPEEGRPRLRFPGDRSTETWKSLQTGALSFAQGCFKAIRNPVAHDHEFPLSRQEALEHLTALSVLARWIDDCELEEAARSQLLAT
jgi:hypothetical protein